MLQGPDVIFIDLLGRRMLGIVLTCADPCCAVQQDEEITKESLRDFNMKVRWQGHVNTLPADHLGRVRAGEGGWKQYEAVSNIYWS